MGDAVCCQRGRQGRLRRKGARQSADHNDRRAAVLFGAAVDLPALPAPLPASLPDCLLRCLPLPTSAPWVQNVDPRQLQISLTGFLEKNTSLFCKVRF